MAEYMNAILTNEGYKLLFNAIRNNTKVNFTSLAAGAGICFERTKPQTVKNIRGMTSLVDEKQRVNFKNVNTDDNFAILEAVLSSKDINSNNGYEITELGVFATDGISDTEVLYAVILPVAQYDTTIKDYVVNSDYMPPYIEGTAAFEYDMVISVMISDGEGV